MDDLKRLSEAVEDEFDESGRYSLSVYSLPGLDARQILERGCADNVNLPSYSFVRVTSVGQLRAAGYDVELTDPASGHSDLVLPSAFSEAHWQTLRGLMALETNPIKGKV